MSLAADEMRRYMQERRLAVRKRLTAMLGGSCVKCGAIDDLEIDHVDPKTKSFTLSGSNLDKPWPALEAEVAKCQLLCSTHHRQKTTAESAARYQHGTNSMYVKKRCRCTPCKEAMTAYRRSLRGC